MSPRQVIRHFGGESASVAQAAKELGCSRQTIYRWVESGEVPLLQQFRIQARTDGKLKVDPRTGA